MGHASNEIVITEEQLSGMAKFMKIGSAVFGLKSHPNYESKIPYAGETKTQFTLRWIAHLVSPPMLEGESNEIECVDLRDAILAMEQEIEKVWNDSNNSKKGDETGALAD